MKLSHRLDPTRLSWQSAMRIGPVLAWAVALSVTAWVGADLFWRFSAPRAPALPVASPSDPQLAAQAIASRHLMGNTATGTSTAGPAIAASGRYALQAIVTGSGGRPGWAVLSIDGGPQQGVVEGQEFHPGVRLAKVLADSIQITTGSSTQTVMLTDRGSLGTPPGNGPGPAGIAQLPQLQAPPITENNTEAPDSGPRPAPIGLPAGFQVQPVPSQ
ncbi:MAG: type II secretion system protein N [Zoogloea sp.]|uniref:type II secretion system protein N n=1 Tax=Zoogloea sp. TaxID=49181 RepID=UPI0026115769|nr:type II secretion system protein N [Zoogloea sp.]MDD2987374.1 type II secretion system protein N [Zoogloea sp.]